MGSDYDISSRDTGMWSGGWLWPFAPWRPSIIEPGKYMLFYHKYLRIAENLSFRAFLAKLLTFITIQKISLCFSLWGI